MNVLITTTVFGLDFCRYLWGNATAMKRSIDIAVTNIIELVIPMHSNIETMLPSRGMLSAPKAHRSRIRASAKQTTRPTKRSVAHMKPRNAENALPKHRREFLYSTTKMTPFGSEIIKSKKRKSIPLPRQTFFSKWGSMFRRDVSFHL